MVKISIQKAKKKSIKPKPRQKQKQKQSQKIVVNMGKGQLKPSNTPVYIPQSNPIMMKPQTDQSMIELIKYLRESEGQKNVIAQKEQNELEKIKKDITPEDKQVYFSTVDNKTTLTPTGIAEKLKFDTLIGNTPSSQYVLPANMKASAGPHNPMSFYDSLKQRADLQGGNPATGQLSLSIPVQPVSTSILRHVSHTSNSQLTDLLRSRITAPAPEAPTPPPAPEPPPEPPAPQPIPEPLEIPGPQPIPEPQLAPEPIQPQVEDDEFFDIPEEELAPEPEQQEPPLEVIDNTPTEAQQLIGMDSTTTPTAQRPITDISPPVHLKDIVQEQTGAAQADEALQLMQKALSPAKSTGPEGGGGNTNKPPYTLDEINKMSVEKLGQLIATNDITDESFTPLIYNETKKRVYRASNLGKQIDKPDLKSYVIAHYYPK